MRERIEELVTRLDKSQNRRAEVEREAATHLADYERVCDSLDKAEAVLREAKYQAVGDLENIKGLTAERDEWKATAEGHERDSELALTLAEQRIEELADSTQRFPTTDTGTETVVGL
jgi:hypothetical protein